MRIVLSNVKLMINENVYLKDPESSALGKKILNESILLIKEIGFEAFTFKKLGQRIESNESSIYRYFENKHKLLVYLTSWYWSWMEYRLVFETANLTDPKDRLNKTIALFTEETKDDESTEHINEALLQQIIISDFTKTLLTKEVDEENRNGFFVIYKRVIHRIAGIIKEVNSSYPYPDSLASTIVEGALHQHFLKQHLTSITNCSDEISPSDFYLDLINKVLN
ncbi:TetR family transcriptional regulator [Flavobacterium beibuense F44-8]|uniref:TetR family transcriptional regulator n=1 Tax=Flavobacterium beibuense F44-8 TaxID=1406840 RepID=A0A0A2LK20_9FLAO|nr:TetR/AcrR family transcriptional regulator [Flavobacterium beibuense]KGO80239.1 TetR family transcriptional regulator [Flavobacterium beibuense F44-8]